QRWGAGERTCRAPSGDAGFDPAIRSRGGKPSDKSPIGAELHHQRENRGTNKRSGSVGRSCKPRQLMLIPTWWWVISARTFLDRLTNAPDLVANAKRIRCPVLFIRGDQEPVENYPAEKFKENCSGPCEIAIIPNCDHFYVGAEEKIAKSVKEWVRRTLTLPSPSQGEG